MGRIVRQLPTLVAAATSANATTNPIGGLDDAAAITFYMVSTAPATSTGTGLLLQVCMFDPSLASSASETGTTVSTAYQTLSTTIFSSGTGLITSSGYAITISPIAFRGLRISGLTSATSGEKIAWVTKQIEV